jgi:predicted O-methyltransferase YrrM
MKRNIRLWGKDTEILASYAKKCNGDAIEIGTYSGGSTIILAKNLINGIIFSIDPYDLIDIDCSIPLSNIINKILIRKVKHDFLNSIENDDFLMTHIVLIQDFSYNVANKFEDCNYDLIFIDGDHSYPSIKLDLMMYIPKLKSGGILIVHDKGWPGVRRAVREEVTEDRFSDIQFDIPDSLMACIGVKK